MTDGTTTSGVIVRPPYLFLGAMALGLVADRWIVPLDIFGAVSWAARQWMAAALVFCGVAAVVDCARRFRRAGTSVPTSSPTSAIVSSGLYRYSRNPIYVGLTMIHLGVAVSDNNAWLLILLAPTLLILRYGVVAREEAYLERRFGDGYRGYRARVRRWI
ncbi:MAG: isoprenylcysteine carboxylmethyltransferase family protein [Rhodospirillales bacterium]|nr:isoprenylcysteine carboxylmethyltransferase family protein [Rhodospirillales bacterium]QQS12373.1 MAG: isoprenylcysteine carboxylmethyltransferase family protein [Rhodospirillales bacterium]